MAAAALLIIAAYAILIGGVAGTIFGHAELVIVLPIGMALILVASR